MESLGVARVKGYGVRDANSHELRRAKKLADEIVSELMVYRRVVDSNNSCTGVHCQACISPHYDKIIQSILLDQPLKFVLPAFPGKSPNIAKVLGPLPDLAEHLALRRLDDLCQKIGDIYQKGAHIILSSDGRVFSDIVRMKEEDVSNYLIEIERIIQKLQLKNLSTFSLDEVYDESDLIKMRQLLMQEYGASLLSLQESVRRGGSSLSPSLEDIEAHRMYCGITRFLVEDSLYPGQSKSKTAIQKECRLRAYEVIRRSNAWSRLIADKFSDAVRLSIHPQTCGAVKFGIQLLGNESWMTPWHGVAVDTQEGFVLMKKWQAEEQGATLVLDGEGRASHYTLRLPPQPSEMFKGIQNGN